MVTGRRGTLSAALAVPLLLCAVLPPAAVADEPMTLQEEKVVNYAFATRLGSGIYDVNGRTVQVYRFPISWTPRREGPDRVGVRVKLPVTIGFYDFQPRDVVDSGVPQHLDTASFVPGLELRFPVRENWMLMPYAEAGIAVDRSGDAAAYVYTAGVRSVADFTSGRFRLALGNDAVYTRVDAGSEQPGDDFAAIQACLEARHGMGFMAWGKEADYGLYAIFDLQYGDPKFPMEHEDRARLEDQYEVGVTFGRTEPAKLWGIELPRLGFGYRFASGVSVFRFVIGIPAPSLAR